MREFDVAHQPTVLLSAKTRNSQFSQGKRNARYHVNAYTHTHTRTYAHTLTGRGCFRAHVDDLLGLRLCVSFFTPALGPTEGDEKTETVCVSVCLVTHNASCFVTHTYTHTRTLKQVVSNESSPPAKMVPAAAASHFSKYTT